MKFRNDSKTSDTFFANHRFGCCYCDLVLSIATCGTVKAEVFGGFGASPWSARSRYFGHEFKVEMSTMSSQQKFPKFERKEFTIRWASLELNYRINDIGEVHARLGDGTGHPVRLYLRVVLMPDEAFGAGKKHDSGGEE